MKKIKNLEVKTDKLLNIKTTGIREWSNKPYYHRTESTPYKAIIELFECVSIKPEDTFVDFGCGKGRICFYVHNLFNSFVKGIEAKASTFDDALYNLDSYTKKINNYNNKINFIFAKAEEYPVQKEDNIFYFFNPFSVLIFKTVVSNILKSFNENNREITIITFYLLEEYRDFIELNTPFKVEKIVTLLNQPDQYQRFIIYKLK